MKFVSMSLKVSEDDITLSERFSKVLEEQDITWPIRFFYIPGRLGGKQTN